VDIGGLLQMLLGGMMGGKGGGGGGAAGPMTGAPGATSPWIAAGSQAGGPPVQTRAQAWGGTGAPPSGQASAGGLGSILGLLGGMGGSGGGGGAAAGGSGSGGMGQLGKSSKDNLDALLMLAQILQGAQANNVPLSAPNTTLPGHRSGRLY
jgi:hypothetical protein